VGRGSGGNGLPAGGKLLPVGLPPSGRGSISRGVGVGGGIFLDPVAPLLVIGGAIAVAAMRSTMGDCARAFAALGPLLRAAPERDAQAARVAVNRIVEQAHAASIASVDRAPLVEQFLARASRVLADSADADAFRRWGEEEVAARAARHAAAHAFWGAAADAAPALGMIGTVIGLIGMFGAMNDPAAIGPGMALALTTTLWGIVIANIVAGPIAARLQRLSACEIAWQEKALGRLETLAREELRASPAPVETRVTSIAARRRAA
jgi:chemotaxis protein MotA